MLFHKVAQMCASWKSTRKKLRTCVIVFTNTRGSCRSKQKRSPSSRISDTQQETYLAISVGSQVILRSNKNTNLQASSFVISVCIRIFRTRRKRAFSLCGIIRVNTQDADLSTRQIYRHFYSKNSRFFSFFVKSNTVTLFFSFGILKYSL